tara:strand:- start:1195 stop:1911 length:717 start_codon:yes stop_codon:yes gene_type:complete
MDNIGMIILGIESATSQVGCAIGGHEGVLASTHSSRGRRHAENLTPQIDFVREQARISLNEISVIAVDIGPGLYTGLRVGVATAISMAFGLGVPMIGISSLDLLAYPVRHCAKLIVPAIDARRGEIFHANYRQVPGGVQRISEPSVSTPDDVAADLLAHGNEALLVGDGAIRYSEIFANLRGVEAAEPSMAYPSAASIVQLAHAKALREEFVSPTELEPMYLRKPDAIEIEHQKKKIL